MIKMILEIASASSFYFESPTTFLLAKITTIPKVPGTFGVTQRLNPQMWLGAKLPSSVSNDVNEAEPSG